MKKVLFVATVTGHINTFHIPFLKLFKNNSYEVHVASKGEKKIEFCDSRFEIPFERFPLKWNNVKSYKKLKKIINDNNYDIIHCHTPVGGVLTRLAATKARKKGTRVIYTAHGFHFYKGASIKNWLLFYPIEWFLAKKTDTIITINDEDYLLARKRFEKRCRDIKCIYGVGINTQKFTFKMSSLSEKKLRESLGLKKEDFVMIFPARLDKNKNQSFLIDVMKLLVKKHSNIHLLLPGSDELNGYYQDIVNKNKLKKNIHFLGYRNDIPSLMKISNIAVSSSLREGLPVNVMESLMCNVPVVALKCRGMEQLIENGVNGYLIDINNHNKLYEFEERVLNYYNGKKYQKTNKKIDITIDEILEKMRRVYFYNK